MGSGDVCPATGRLLAFAGDDGSVARMAVVRAAAPPVSGLSAKKSPASFSTIGRYVVGPKIAAGGMATVHIGRLRGSAGFARTVAIKRLLPELAKDPEFVARFCDEARIASRVRHANVVPTLDVVDDPEVLLVLEYVHGESLARLLRIAGSRGERCPPAVASAIVIGVLRGLHVAHQAKGANGIPLDLVHRDVSPQNVIVGADGAPRVLDFGIAKAAGREQSTINKGSSADLRGKLAYMAPEQVSGEPIDRRADLFAAGVILWETLASERLFKGEDAMQTMEAIFHRDPPPLANGLAKVSSRVDEVLATALSKDAAQRYTTADEMARAIEIALPPGSDREVAEWVEAIGAESLSARAAVIARFEGSTEGAEEDDRDDPNDPTTLKRSALMPPALEPKAVLPGAAPPQIRDSARTIPGFDASQLGALEAAPPAARFPVPNPAAEPLRTPLSMVTPAVTPPVDPFGASDMTETRFGPIDVDGKRRPHHVVPLRTPIPMPMPMTKPRFSAAKVAALILMPPLVAALSLFVIRPTLAGSASAEADGTNANAPPAVVADPPPPAPPPPPLAAKVIEPAPHAVTPTSTPTTTAPSARAAPRYRGASPRVPRRR